MIPTNIKKLKIGLVGTGNVATHLSLYIRHKGFTINAVTGRTLQSAKKLAQQLHCRNYSDDIAVMERSHLILIAVSDPAISGLAETISSLSFRESVVYVAHTSGSILSSALYSSKKNKTSKLYLASFHPMQTFPSAAIRSRLYYKNLNKIFFGIEGEAAAVKILKRLSTELNNKFIILPSDLRKQLYHIGGIIACNFLTALLYQVYDLYSPLSLTEKNTLKILRPLIHQTLNNSEQYGGIQALTGPAARNDQVAVNEHIQLLYKSKPELVPVYQALSTLCRNMKLQNIQRNTK